ncbi:beta-D-glucosyl crocetin beta-1,6-glucosyltransferase-like [Solanum verrucosum]|uniref:beta-D-glucosyl crocetin beta-1,6-glucosyltransferase-like n=1 Tax=Solanum verrucosum TaxID=315347 RepID=UPI0020D02A93|nr:beta-D-glucosyl crocetin beta-1,6-glucosyltransferase-like [Solanum verrucosum]
MCTKSTKWKVFLFPWLAYGHISPFLELAKKLVDRGFLVDLCSSSINLSFIRTRIPETYCSSIHLVELQLPDLQELPPHYHTANGLPLHLHSTLQKALKMAKPNLLNILEARKPDLLIHDVKQLWAAGVASTLDIPAVRFFTSCAAMCSYFSHLFVKPNVEFPFQALRLNPYELTKAHKVVKEHREDDDPEVRAPEEFTGVMLIGTSREMEGKYIDYMSEIIKFKVLPIGTLVQDPMTSVDGNREIMEWLGKKDKFSTILVSFGSGYFLTNQELEEVAFGLELSQVNFIWVVRFPKGENLSLEEALPQGFFERIGHRGMVMGGWAPQAKILTHSSIGGFVSHCGWNSISESIDYGIPIIAMPMDLDQPMNAKLLVEIGVALEVLRDENGALHREDIARVIKDVICGKSGENLRCNVRNLGKKLRFKNVEDIDAAVMELTQLCHEKNHSSWIRVTGMEPRLVEPSKMELSSANSD